MARALMSVVQALGLVAAAGDDLDEAIAAAVACIRDGCGVEVTLIRGNHRPLTPVTPWFVRRCQTMAF